MFFSEDLENIYRLLKEYRHYEEFVFSKRLPNVDFYAIHHGIIIEFDEPQHFTKPREIALSNYPNSLDIGFDKNKWQSLCMILNRKDKNPIYRDEQRAWYDTLRDFVPKILNIKPTIRLYSSDFVWCSLDPVSQSDLAKFENIIKAKGYMDS